MHLWCKANMEKFYFMPENVHLLPDFRENWMLVCSTLGREGYCGRDMFRKNIEFYFRRARPESAIEERAEL